MTTHNDEQISSNKNQETERGTERDEKLNELTAIATTTNKIVAI